MRHEILTQRARFCIGVMAKKGTLSQHFVTHVVPPLHVASCAWSRRVQPCMQHACNTVGVWFRSGQCLCF